MSTSSSAPPAAAFWHFQDEAGRDTVVDSWEDVPPQHRPHAVRVDMASDLPLGQPLMVSPPKVAAVRGPANVKAPPTNVAVDAPTAPGKAHGDARHVHSPSAALGMLATLVVVFLAKLLKGMGAGWLAVALLGSFAAGVGYLAFVDFTQAQVDEAAHGPPVSQQPAPAATPVAPSQVEKALERALQTAE